MNERIGLSPYAIYLNPFESCNGGMDACAMKMTIACSRVRAHITYCTSRITELFAYRKTILPFIVMLSYLMRPSDQMGTFVICEPTDFTHNTEQSDFRTLNTLILLFWTVMTTIIIFLLNCFVNCLKQRREAGSHLQSTALLRQLSLTTLLSVWVSASVCSAIATCCRECVLRFALMAWGVTRFQPSPKKKKQKN